MRTAYNKPILKLQRKGSHGRLRCADRCENDIRLCIGETGGWNRTALYKSISNYFWSDIVKCGNVNSLGTCFIGIQVLGNGTEYQSSLKHSVPFVIDIMELPRLKGQIISRTQIRSDTDIRQIKFIILLSIFIVEQCC